MKKWIGIMLCLLLAALCCAAMAEVEINETNFPDKNFREAIRRRCDKNEDGILSEYELNSTEKLYLRWCEIQNLKGIGFFTELTELNCSGNDLKELDLSLNTKLKDLNCSENKLKQLNLSRNTALWDLECGGNLLASLDLSSLSELYDLNCENNKLSKLDVSHNPRLMVCVCRDNSLTKLDVSRNPDLERIECQGNKLTKLDVSKCSKLCKAVKSKKRETLSEGSQYPYDMISYSICIDIDVTVIAGKKTSKPIALYNRVREIVEGYTNASMTEREKALALHNWLCNNAEYDYTYTHHGAEGVLLLGTGVCDSYSRAYKLLLDEVGIRNIRVIGYATSSTSWFPESHAWNYVCIDGVWSHVDVTWDDGTRSMKYFMISSEQIRRDHDWDTPLPGDNPVTSITLNKKKATLTRTADDPKPTLQLKATVAPGNAADPSLEWSSSDPKVARVDANGEVTALKKGKAVITCLANDGSGVKATCRITVKDKKVTGITLNETEITIKKGEVFELKVTKVKPLSAVNQKVKWTTSNKKIAAVDKNGIVKAKKKGTCIITCKAADGSGVKVKVKVTVE